MRHSNLKRKTLIPTGILMVAIIAVLTALAVVSLNRSYEQVIKSTEYGFDNDIKIAVETVIGALQANYQQYNDGVITEKEAVETAKTIVRDARYSSAPDKYDDGYFWADMEDGYCVVHYNPANEGTMRWDAQDQEGTYFIRKFIENGNAGGGYSDFYFGKPGDESGSHKKRGYTEKFEPYGWYISTGNYYEDTDQILEGVHAEKHLTYILLFGVSVLVAGIGLMVLSRSIGEIVIKPIQKIFGHVKALSIGDVTNDIEIDMRDDEIGELERSIQALSITIKNQTDVMQLIAGGDYSMTIDVRSDEDAINRAINLMIDKTNDILYQINNAATQVASGSKQIANGSQSLAQGAIQQAATVEEISASASTIAKRTKENAEMAGNAASLANSIKGSAEKGNQHMVEMMSAVDEITQASQGISKVIKVIDDIAFQTNILALNAAVEAARAGQHGKGFAVVADEVRNLAAKSAEAAKDTGSLITNSIEKAELGERIAKETASSLVEIVSGINESNRIVSEIAVSSGAQTLDIEQINNEIGQVSHIVQQNSATAEESAAAAEEMSGQSDLLENLISKFKLKRI